MDLSLDELIKKQKPERKKNNNNKNNNNNNRGNNKNKKNSFHNNNNNRNNNCRNNNKKKKRSRDNYDNSSNNKKQKYNRRDKKGGSGGRERFHFKPQWRGDFVALQLDGIDMVQINFQGKIILHSGGDFSKRTLQAFNSVLKQFKLNVQPSMNPGQWTIYDNEVPEYRQNFFDGMYVLDAKKDPARMRKRWDTINAAYGRDAKAEAKKLLDDQLLQRQKQEEEEKKKMDAMMWIRPKNHADEDLYDEERKKLPVHEQSGAIYFLRALSERKGWEEPKFEQETNEDGLIGYSVKLHILDEIIAPSEWFENDGDAMVSVANEALDIVKAWHEAQQEVEAEEEEEEGNPTDNGGSSAHVWRPGQ